MLTHRAFALTVLLGLAVAARVFAQAEATIEDVLTLRGKGLSDPEIKAELVRRDAAFRPLTETELLRLRGAGVGPELEAWIAWGGVRRHGADTTGLPPGPQSPVPPWPDPAVAVRHEGRSTSPDSERAPATITLASLAAMVGANESTWIMLDRVLDPSARFAVSAADLDRLEAERVPLEVRLVLAQRRLDAASLGRLLRETRDARYPLAVLDELGFTGAFDLASIADVPRFRIATELIAGLRRGRFDHAPRSRIGGAAVRVAVVLPDTGPRSARARSARQALELVCAQANVPNGAGAIALELVMHREPADAAQAAALAQTLADDPSIVAVIGHLEPAAAAQIGDTYDRREVPEIRLDHAAADGGGRGFLNMSPRPGRDGAFLARYLHRACGHRKLAVIAEREPDGTAVRDGFADEVAHLGLVADERYDRGGADLAGAVARVAAAAPGAVLLAGTPADALAILAEARRIGLAALFVGRADLLEPAPAGDLAEGLRVCSDAGEGGVFRVAYRRAHGTEPDPTALLAADALGFLVDTLQRAGCDRARLRAALAARDTPAEAYSGVAGAMYVDALGNAVRPRSVLERRGGVWTPCAAQLAEADDADLAAVRSPPFARRATEASRLAACRSGGGSVATEQAVEAALRWLARHQHADGAWRGNDGAYPVDQGTGKMSWVHPGGTALALLALLGAGHTHARGEHAPAVQRGLGYLLTNQEPNGRVGGQRGHYLYNHAIASLALVEAHAMEPDRRLRAAATEAVRYLLAAQNPGQAWRYGERDGDNDISVTGWCVKVLVAARTAGIRAPGIDAGLSAALAWIESITDAECGVSGYKACPPRGWRGPTSARFQNDELAVNTAITHAPNHTPTAIATACRGLAGLAASDARVVRGCGHLALMVPEWRPAGGGLSRIDYYYWLWGTEALVWCDAPARPAWNAALVSALLEHQRRDGPLQGSWDPIDAWSFAAGRTYATAMCALTLEAYYRVESGTRR